MARMQPWDGKWKLGPELSRGGQGITYEVASCSNESKRGVLKKLKGNEIPQARRRMHQEVTSLTILGDAGVKVPRVLDGNTDNFGDGRTPLYFVMEYVDGSTLAQLVREKGALTLEQASAVTFDLCGTVSQAHQEGVMHRDIKPDNIIIRSLEPTDAVIVDFGLSFNEKWEQETITQTGDSIRNKFLDLPETNTPNGNLRDPRSDVCAIAGIFCYCITGFVPGQLQDKRAQPPHRRAGHSLAEVLKNNLRLEQLEVFLDQGFAVALEDRFQTCEQFVHRLEMALKGETQAEEEDFATMIEKTTRLLELKDRPSKLKIFSHIIKPVWAAMYQNAQQKYLGVSPLLNITFQGGLHGGISFPNGFEQASDCMSLVVSAPANDMVRGVQLAFGCNGPQCVLLRTFTKPGDQNSKVAWQELFWFKPEANMDPKPFIKAMDEGVKAAIKDLSDAILSAGRQSSR